ncbi:trypsin-like serine peptidase [Peterkaempfera sp. SMS 1(5)a]|uniref:trypsin-like serine peptidase n=1 Tax=Peterkaempfera podocarpi TaxID=3232308 RepID=UPI00366E5081
MFALVTTVPAAAAGDPSGHPDTAGTATAGVTATTSDGSTVDSPAAVAKVLHYWTPERMRNAIPADVVDRNPGTARSVGHPTGPPGEIPPGLARTSQTSTQLAESPAVGRVFFHNPTDNKDYGCSASALNSVSKQLVLTAGHCVNTGGNGSVAGAWMENWIYVPAYRSHSEPYGEFVAFHLHTFNAWINSKDHTRDVGMVATMRNNGRQLANVTGSMGMRWNIAAEEAVTVLGYPTNIDNGEIQDWCTGNTSVVQGQPGVIKIGCNFGPGASGGPWLVAYNEALHIGDANGVSSTVNSSGVNKSPYFDTFVKSMYDIVGTMQ